MQEVVALSIVAIAFGVLLVWSYRGYLAAPLARWLLKRGRVGQAMKVRATAKSPGSSCDGLREVGAGVECLSDDLG